MRGHASTLRGPTSKRNGTSGTPKKTKPMARGMNRRTGHEKHQHPPIRPLPSAQARGHPSQERCAVPVSGEGEMTIYRSSVLHDHNGWIISYHPSKKDALREVNSSKRLDAEVTLGSVLKIEFSPTKYGIINMLNRHTPSHNNG